MSLKAIEMQVALPRTQNAGKIQDQMQQRGQVSQDHIATEQHKELEKKRKQVLELTETENRRLNNDDENRNGANPEKETQQKDRKHEHKHSPQYAKHPYKGNFVDFSG